MRIKKVTLILLILILLFTISGCKSKVTFEPLEGEIADLAEAFINSMITGDFKTAVSYFDETMFKALSESDLSKTWNNLIKQIGSYKGEVGKREEKVQQYDVIFVTSEFEKQLVDIKVVFNSDKRIAGLFFEQPKN